MCLPLALSAARGGGLCVCALYHPFAWLSSSVRSNDPATAKARLPRLWRRRRRRRPAAVVLPSALNVLSLAPARIPGDGPPIFYGRSTERAAVDPEAFPPRARTRSIHPSFPGTHRGTLAFHCCCMGDLMSPPSPQSRHRSQFARGSPRKFELGRCMHECLP